MNIIDGEHHEQKINDNAKNDFKIISNAVTMKKSENIHTAKIISITRSIYPPSYYKSLQQKFSSNPRDVYITNEFACKEPPIDHVMFLKNFCS